GGAQRRAGKLSAAETGSAHHLFLELVSLSCVGTVDRLRGEAQRLLAARRLSAEQVAALNFDEVMSFWRSDVGKEILGRQEEVHRELEFTTRFSAAEVAGLNLMRGIDLLEGEFFVVQGAVDLAVLLKDEIWLLD